jgi:hypothetical protein
MSALDDLADDDTAICPECGAGFTVRKARMEFRKRIVAKRNQKAAQGLLTIAWLAASVAGTLYGIPIPPPPIKEDTFAPYRAPLRITCRRAKKMEPPVIYRDVSLQSVAWLQNPYEKELNPYTVVIDDTGDVKNTKLGMTALPFSEDMIYFETRRR